MELRTQRIVGIGVPGNPPVLDQLLIDIRAPPANDSYRRIEAGPWRL
jgi:hypothetical protein